MSQLSEVLAAGRAPGWLAPAVTAALGPTAAAELDEDPWRLLAVLGVRPEQADAYARARLGPQARPEDPRRARAVVRWLLDRAARDGHSAVPATTVCRALPAFGFTDPEAVLAAVVAEGDVLAVGGAVGGVDGETDAPDERPLLVALEVWAMAEAALSEGVERLLATARHVCGAEQVEGAVTGLDQGTAQAVRAAATSGVSMAVTGTPAATVRLVSAMGALADAAGRRLMVAAATSRAARDVAAAGVPAKTIRELVGGQVTADLVLVTEAAVLDVAGAADVVEALTDGVHLVLVGDPSGLAAPGPGAVLVDLTDSGAVPVSVIEGAGEGPGATLARLASSVRAGKLPRIHPADREVVIVPARDAGEAAHRAVQLVTDSIPRALGIPAGEVLVVTARRSGAAGADALNAALKRRLNPGPGEHGGFDPGDRVVTTSRTLPVASYGEVGEVAGATDDSLDLAFSSGLTSLDPAGWAGLRHGWAVTAHEALAASWPAVVAVFPGEAAGSLSRALVLSSVTTARQHLSVVHAAGPALAQAVERAPRRSRATQRLSSGRTCYSTMGRDGGV